MNPPRGRLGLACIRCDLTAGGKPRRGEAGECDAEQHRRQEDQRAFGGEQQRVDGWSRAEAGETPADAE